MSAPHEQEVRSGPSSPVDVVEIPLPASGFESFTYPRYAPLLSSPGDSGERIAIVASSGNEPVGLALFSRPSEDHGRRLLSVMVSPGLRRQEVGFRLLTLGEECARRRGTKRLTAIHSSALPAKLAYESLVRKAGFSAPVAFEYRLAGKAEWSLLALRDWAPFLERLDRSGFSATAWDELTALEREQIAEIVTNAIPEEDRIFDPFVGEKTLQLIPGLSIVVRRHGTIVGWILGSRGALPDSVHYSCGYALPELQGRGWLAAAVRAISQRQAELLGRETLCVFETAATNSGMQRFMDQRLKPYSLWTHWRYHCEKRLEVTP